MTSFPTRPGGTVKSVGVVGLGIGTLVAYAQPGQRWVLYEIDPEVERIARDSRYFTHLKDCGSRCEVIIGDARLSLQNRSDQYDVLVLDAFSSDSLPVHLLTREAVELYLSRLTENGVLAINISNNHLALRPVVGGIIRDLGLTGRARYQDPKHIDRSFGCRSVAEHARLIASHFGTEHTELEAEATTVAMLPTLARQFDEPVVDSSHSNCRR